LSCRLLDDQPDVVAVNEPRQALRSVDVGDYCAALVRLHAELRQDILRGSPIENKVADGGGVTTDTAQSGEYRACHPSIPSADFVLGTKNTLAYLSRLDSLRSVQRLTIVACIRDPRRTISSWKKAFAHLALADVDTLIDRGVITVNDDLERRRLDDISRTGDLRVRRALFWRHLAMVINRNREWIHVVRYEDLLDNPVGVVSRILTVLGLPPGRTPRIGIAVQARESVALEPEEERIICDVCGPEARAYGYSL